MSKKKSNKPNAQPPKRERRKIQVESSISSSRVVTQMTKNVLKTSKYKGVRYANHCNMWRAEISIDSKVYHITYTKDEALAAKAYDYVYEALVGVSFLNKDSHPELNEKQLSNQAMQKFANRVKLLKEKIFGN